MRQAHSGSTEVSELRVCSLTIDLCLKISRHSFTRTHSALPELCHPHSLDAPVLPWLSPLLPHPPQLPSHTTPSATLRATLASMLLLTHRPSPLGLCTHCASPGCSLKFSLGSFPQFRSLIKHHQLTTLGNQPSLSLSPVLSLQQWSPSDIICAHYCTFIACLCTGM